MRFSRLYQEKHHREPELLDCAQMGRGVEAPGNDTSRIKAGGRQQTFQFRIGRGHKTASTKLVGTRPKASTIHRITSRRASSPSRCASIGEFRIYDVFLEDGNGPRKNGRLVAEPIRFLIPKIQVTATCVTRAGVRVIPNRSIIEFEDHLDPRRGPRHPAEIAGDHG